MNTVSLFACSSYYRHPTITTGHTPMPLPFDYRSFPWTQFSTTVCPQRDRNDTVDDRYRGRIDRRRPVDVRRTPDR